MLLPAGLAFARAGGGEHYTGGGGGSSGDFGGSGGADLYVIFELLRGAIYLTIAYPGVMIPVWLVGGGVGFVWYLRRPSVTTSHEVSRLERQRLQPQADLPAALASLKQRDPAFDEDQLLERTRAIFLEIQEAWFRRRLGDVRHFMSDGLHRRFHVLQDLMKAEGRRDALADVRVQSARILEAKRTEGFDVVTVSIAAEIRDTEVPATVDDEAARAAALRAPKTSFVELWTFVRRPGATTREGFDAGAGRCPNCGAPFDRGATNTCAYCNAIVNSGQYSWVLSEITQASEFLPHHRKAPGLDSLRTRDPDAAAEILEDRALLLFWKWVEGWALNDVKRMRKVSTIGFLDAQVAEKSGYAQRGQRLHIAKPAVGGADVAAVEIDVDGFDRVHVDLRWSAAVALEEHGRTGNASPRFRRHVLTMVRKTGAKTGVEGLATERCGTCRAPLTNSDSPVCDYCGHDLTSAATEWQLGQLVPYEQWRRPVASHVSAAAGRVGVPGTPSAAAAMIGPDDLPVLASRGERVRLLQGMAAVAASDGIISDAELKLLRMCARRWRVDWSEIEPQLRRESLVGFGGSAQADEQERESLLSAVIAMAKVDGRVDAKEKRMILGFAAHLHVSKERVEEMLRAS